MGSFIISQTRKGKCQYFIVDIYVSLRMLKKNFRWYWQNIIINFRSATQFKKNHPVLGILLILGGGYFIVYMLGSVLVFLFGILLPICIVFIHSSMRLRNIKNKLSNKIETIGLKKTPMGIFLESLGMEPEFLS